MQATSEKKNCKRGMRTRKRNRTYRKKALVNEREENLIKGFNERGQEGDCEARARNLIKRVREREEILEFHCFFELQWVVDSRQDR